jgi:hypothetical protein
MIVIINDLSHPSHDGDDDRGRVDNDLLIYRKGVFGVSITEL